MIFKLISKDKNCNLINDEINIRTSFHVKGSFLYFRGVKIGICNYLTMFKNEKLFVEKGEILETYELKSKFEYFGYEICEDLLRIYGSEKLIKFKKIVEINDGLILENDKIIFIRAEQGKDDDNKDDYNIVNEDIDLNKNSNFLIDNILHYSPNFIFYKNQMQCIPLKLDIDLIYNLIIPEIFIKNNLYCVKQDDTNYDTDNNCYNLFTPLQSNDFYLSESSLNFNFNSTGKLLLFINDLFLVSDSVSIKGVILASSFYFNDKFLKIAVTNSEVFMIYEKFFCYFHHNEIIFHINKSQNEIPTLSALNGSISLDKMYFTLSLFSDLPIFFNENLEFFIFDLFIYTNLGLDFLNKIYKEKGWSFEFESILCDIYRLVDDKNKKLIYNFIENHLQDLVNLNTLKNLKKIIIFHPDLIPNYILRCINEFKEFEIEELIEHFKNSEIIKIISKELLRNNCFYLFTLCCPEYEKYFDKDLLKIEKYNLISQRNREGNNDVVLLL